MQVQLLDSTKQQDTLEDLRGSLLTLETNLPWTSVTKGFASIRTNWRRDVGRINSLQQLLRLYKEFLPVRCPTEPALTRCVLLTGLLF